MEIAYINEKNIKLKGKQVTILINLPEGKAKQQADTVLLLGKERTTDFFAGDSGIVFQGPGEYEVKATKITGFKVDEEVMYTITLDGISIFIGNVSSAEKIKDTLHEHNIAVLFANDVLSQATMGVFNASVLVFTGEKSLENAKAFDKEVAPVGKYAITKDKLPSETEFVFLG